MHSHIHKNSENQGCRQRVLRNPISELPRLQNNTLWILTSEELIFILSHGNAELTNIQKGMIQ